MKCRVLKKCSLVVEKDSIVELDQRQVELAKGLVLPLDEQQEEKKEVKKKTKKGE